MREWLLVVCCLLLVICGCGQVIKSSSTETTITNAAFDSTKVTVETITYGTTTTTQEVVSNQVLVTLVEGKTKSDLENITKDLSCAVVGENSLSRTYQVQIPTTATLSSILTSISANTTVVQGVGYNSIVYGDMTPNDDASVATSYGWPYTAISAEAAWDLTTGEAGAKVAVVDTGIYFYSADPQKTKMHAELDSTRLEYVSGCDLLSNDSDPTDEEDVNGHGTSVMSILGSKGNNEYYMAGMDWTCKLLPIRALLGKSATDGQQKTDTFTYINGIYKATRAGAKVINCSGGSYLYSAFVWNWSTINEYNKVAELCNTNGTLVVCSAGNDNGSADNHYPSCLTGSYDSVISVGAITQGNARWVSGSKGSNYGTYVDIAAPGHGIFVLAKPIFTTSEEGTSVAAPFVTGTASLMFALASQEGYSLTSAQVKSTIKSTSYSDAITTDQNVGRKLNAYKALLGALSLCNRAVVSVTSNVAGAAIWISYNSGSAYYDTGKTTSSTEAVRMVIASGSTYDYRFRASKSGYNPATSEVYPSVAAGAEVPITLNPTSTDPFTINTLDSSGYVNAKTSLAIRNNKSYISYAYYYGSTNYLLKYISNSSGSWSKETVDSTVYGGNDNAIAVDSSGKCHISYYDCTHSALRYATNTTGSWQNTIIDNSAVWSGVESSIAVDSGDKAHICYYNSNPQFALMYATNTSGSWATTTVEATNIAGEYPSIAIHADGHAHVGYRYNISNSDYYLKYATNSSGAWLSEVVNHSGAHGGMGISLVLDNNEFAHIAYCNPTAYYLKCASNESGSWVSTTVDSTGNADDSYISLARDSNNKFHIAYYDQTNKDLKYATNKSGSWVSITVDSSGDVGLYPSIAIDSSNKAHISYVDYTHGYLKYAVEN